MNMRAVAKRKFNTSPFFISTAFVLVLLATGVQNTKAAGPASIAAVDLSKTKVKFDSKSLATKVTREIEKAIPTEPQDEIILLNGQPECIRFRFDDQKVESDNFFGRKHLLIFPLQKYAAQNTLERKRSFDDQLNQLKKMLKTKTDTSNSAIPIFPQSDAAEVFHNQVRFLNFKSGTGVSFISSYANGDPPLKKDSQFYCFQGLSTDKRYYVSFFWPLTVESIPENLPITKGVRFLQKLPRDKFVPNLDTLDRAIESLQID